MIAVLRLGHRITRDKRITTHVALVARSFGADTIYITTKDSTLEHTISSICQRFGGEFSIHTGVKAKTLLSQWKGTIVHLTMYGEPFETVLPTLNRKKDILIIIGSEKVPFYYYDIADYNVAVGNQPHSEVAALALFLDRYTTGTWQTQKFKGELEIIPSKKGKHVKSR